MLAGILNVPFLLLHKYTGTKESELNVNSCRYHEGLRIRSMSLQYVPFYWCALGSWSSPESLAVSSNNLFFASYAVSKFAPFDVAEIRKYPCFFKQKNK
jgi:hypothetical protein